MKLYVLVDPHGRPIHYTVNTTKSEVWYQGFETVAEIEGPEWRSKNWKLLNPSLRSAKKLGWSIQPCEITLLKPS
jgi:hypothetical protein